MPKITPREYTEAKRTSRIDLSAVKADAEFMQQLKAAGIKPEDLDKMDVVDHDGQIDGPRELRSLFSLLKAKQRGTDPDSMTINSGPDAQTPIDRAYDAFESHFTPSTRAVVKLPAVGPNARTRFPLKAAVGPGEANAPDDVRLVQTRLKEVGFSLSVTGRFSAETENTIKAYRAMLLGTEFSKEEEGRITLNDVVDHALASRAPPKWEKMPTSGAGFVNDDTDGYSFGSAVAREALTEIAAAYERTHLTSHPAAAKFSLNDVSTRNGGANRDHETHQNGLDLDIRLPRLDGTVGSDVRWSNYDRETTWAMLQVIAANPRVERVLFSDPQLLSRVHLQKPLWAYKVFDGGSVHVNHIHIDVKPPAVTPQID